MRLVGSAALADVEVEVEVVEDGRESESGLWINSSASWERRRRMEWRREIGRLWSCLSAMGVVTSFLPFIARGRGRGSSKFARVQDVDVDVVLRSVRLKSCK
jgi:hypothetical protein